MKSENIREYLKASNKRFCKIINKVLEFKKKFKNELHKVDLYLFQSVLPRVPTKVLSNFLNWYNIVIYIFYYRLKLGPTLI